MDFSYLSTTQIVTLVLAVVFSVLAVATTFFAFKNAEKLKSQAIIFVLTLVMPFVAITCWLILTFTFVNGFKGNDILNIFVSLAIALFTCFMILLIANALYKKHKKDLEGISEMEKAANKLEEPKPATKVNEEVVEAAPAKEEEASSWTLQEVVETPAEEVEVETAEETTEESAEEPAVEETEETTEETVEEPAEENKDTETVEEDEIIEPAKSNNFWLSDDDE